MNMRMLYTREELIAAGYPYGKVYDGIPFGNPATEWMRTNPDSIIYAPAKDMAGDCDNCVLAVTELPDGSGLMAMWTQSSCEGHGDNRILISKSKDGMIWSQPKFVLGRTDPDDTEHMQSSWGMPMFSASGRLYMFFIQETENGDVPGVASGVLGIVCSDDCGETWSEPAYLNLPRSRWDNPDPVKNKNWWSSRGPVKDDKGRWYSDFATQISSALAVPGRTYPHQETYGGVIRFDNLDDDPAPKDVRFTLLPDENGIAVPDKLFLEMSVAQETSPAVLPDGRIYAQMRNMSGYLQYVVGDDEKWTQPKPVIGYDGEPIKHPLSPCPIFRLKDGRYLMFSNLNDGRIEGFDWVKIPCDPFSGYAVRNPLYMMVGVYDPNSEQPIRFGKPYKLFDMDNVSVGGRKKSCTAPLYMALTQWNGKNMLWYPDRKYYLLGKELPDALIDELTPDM